MQIFLSLVVAPITYLRGCDNFLYFCQSQTTPGFIKILLKSHIFPPDCQKKSCTLSIQPTLTYKRVADMITEKMKARTSIASAEKLLE